MFETEVEGITESLNVSLKYNGWSLMFGRVVPELQLQATVNEEFVVSLKPSIMICVAYFLPSLAWIILRIFKKDSHVTGFVMAICFLISAVLLFMTLKVCSMNIDVYNGMYIVEEGSASLQSIGYKISYGPIIGALIACVGTIISFSYAMQKEEK